MARRVVYVCRGGDCRSAKAERRVLLEQLGDVATVEEVRCQSICRGPVAGLEVGGRLEWFQRLDKKKARRALAKLARRGGTLDDLPDRLARRRVAKRAGRRR